MRKSRETAPYRDAIALANQMWPEQKISKASAGCYTPIHHAIREFVSKLYRKEYDTVELDSIQANAAQKEKEIQSRKVSRHLKRLK